MKQFLVSIKKGGWVVIAVAATLGFILMLAPKVKNDGVQSAAAGKQIMMTMTEDKIKALCEKVDGVGETTVAVTYDEKDGRSVICGVGIVCEGGDDPETERKLLSLVSAACGVPTNKIYIAGGK